MTSKDKKAEGRGVSARIIILLMAAVAILFAALLLANYRANEENSRMRAATDNYIHWQRDAYELQKASDYLTEQVRCFTETGERKYLDNYFEEAKVTRRRDRAVSSIRQYLEDSQAYAALRAAMDESVQLMDREYYAMRLTVAAYCYSLADFPEEVRNVLLSVRDAAYTSEEKEALARKMVFDDEYHRKKEAISADMQLCLIELAREIGAQQDASADRWERLLAIQRVLIISAIAVTLLVMILTLLLVIRPLLRAVKSIRAEGPIPIRGSKEFRFLAQTYNLMHGAGRERKEQ